MHSFQEEKATRELATVTTANRVVPMGKDRRVIKKPGSAEVGVRVHFQIEGSGNFVASHANTRDGTQNVWVKPQTVLWLEAMADPGSRFSHWVVKNDYAGASPTRRVVAECGMVVKAVFVAIDRDEVE